MIVIMIMIIVYCILYVYSHSYSQSVVVVVKAAPPKVGTVMRRSYVKQYPKNSPRTRFQHTPGAFTTYSLSLCCFRYFKVSIGKEVRKENTSSSSSSLSPWPSPESSPQVATIVDSLLILVGA